MKIIRLSLIAGVVTLVACGGSGSGPSASPDQPGPASSMIIIAGDGQQGMAATELPIALTVKVVDAAGTAVAGQIVNFHVTQGGGRVFAGAANSDSNGTARERWTMGTTAGPQKIEARAVDANGSPVVYATFTATATPGPATTLRLDAGNAQTAQQLTTLPTSIRTKVVDQYGNPVPGAAVTFVLASNSGSVSPASVTTGAEGSASTSWTLGSALGTQTIEARVPGLAAAAFTATSTVGPLQARLIVASGANQTGAVATVLAHPVIVQLTELGGAPIAAQAVTFTVKAGGGTVTSTGSTGQDGKASALWQLGTNVAAQQIEVKSVDPVSQLQVGPVTIDAVAVAGPPATVAPDDTAPASPHRTFTIRARVLDAYANPISGASVSFTPCSTCGTAAPPASATDANGWATSAWTHTTTAGIQTLDARSGTASGTFHHTVAPGEIYDGNYVGGQLVPDPAHTPSTTDPSYATQNCSFGISFSVVDGSVTLSFKGIIGTVDASGSFSLRTGIHVPSVFAGTIRPDGSASGTYYHANVPDAYCYAVWSASRQ